MEHEKRYSTDEASKFLEALGVILTPASLNTLRSLGRGPRYIKVPGGRKRVLYPESSLIEFASGAHHATRDSICLKKS